MEPFSGTPPPACFIGQEASNFTVGSLQPAMESVSSTAAASALLSASISDGNSGFTSYICSQDTSPAGVFGSFGTVDETEEVPARPPRGRSLMLKDDVKKPISATVSVDHYFPIGANSTVLEPKIGAGEFSFGKEGMKSVASLQQLLMDDSIPFCITCAWVPSERTSGALSAIAASVPATDFIGADQQTKPGILSDRLFKNPAFDLALRLVGTIPPSLIADNPDELLNKGDIRGLLEKGFYSSAANLSGRLLQTFDQGIGKTGSVTKHTPSSLTLWHYRILSLLFLDQTELAAKEIEAFGDLENPDLYLEFFKEEFMGCRAGSMVPFHFRLLYARIPLLLGTPRLSLERLFTIRTKVEQILSNATAGIFPPGVSDSKLFWNVWRNRRNIVLKHICGVAVSSEDFDTAFRIIRLLMKLDSERLPSLWHALGLLYCHIGSPTMAAVCFTESIKLSPENLYMDLLQTSILSVCGDSPAAALENYLQLFNKFPGDVGAANGIAIGHFYSGRMSEAILFLENLVFTQPKVFLTEQTVINLVSMYELQNIEVRARKLRLLSLLCQFMPDGGPVAALKLQDSL